MSSARPSVILSTRIWRFQTDEIRLSAFSNSPFLAFMRERFGFEYAQLAPPQYPGADPQYASPPGIALEHGLGPVRFDSQGEPQDYISVRSMGIDANNIAIEVAGPTQYADEIYAFFRNLMADAATPEGDPYIGTHRSIRDFSMISIPGVVRSAERMTGSSFYKALRTHFDDPSDEHITAELSFTIEGGEVPSIWTLRPRFRTSAKDAVLESQAWLSSDDHLALLSDIDEISASSSLALAAEKESQ